MQGPEHNPGTHQLVDHLFRHEAGKMVAVLSHLFGLHHLDLIEDVVQDAFSQALQTWKFHQLPANPSAWLMQVAKNKTLDLLRQQKNRQRLLNVITQGEKSFELDQFFAAHEIADSSLRLIFTCCHPRLKTEDQIAFTLKTASGFGIREIAQALLVTEDVIKQRLHRARQWIIQEHIDISFPTGHELESRTHAVLTTLYLLFNEGYYSSKPDETIRQDLCLEAMRLLKVLLDHPYGNSPAANALLALMFYHSARFSTRTDADYNLVLLADQDRSKWDQDLIQLGHRFMDKSLKPQVYTVYHLEAAIAAQHCMAPSLASTDWSRLLKLYDLLGELKPSPLLVLNRVVVLLQMHAFQEAKKALEHIRHQHFGSRHYLFYAVEAEYHTLMNDFGAARHALASALSLANSSAEKKLLTTKLAALDK